MSAKWDNLTLSNIHLHYSARIGLCDKNISVLVKVITTFSDIMQRPIYYDIQDKNIECVLCLHKLSVMLWKYIEEISPKKTNHTLADQNSKLSKFLIILVIIIVNIDDIINSDDNHSVISRLHSTKNNHILCRGKNGFMIQILE